MSENLAIDEFGRADPTFAGLEDFARNDADYDASEPSEPTLAEELTASYTSGYVADTDFTANKPSPLRLPYATQGGSLTGRTLTVVASLAIHFAATSFFWETTPQVQIAGGEPITVTMIGNAFEDAVLSGEAEIEPVPVQEPVETVEPLEPTPPTETQPEPLEPVETAEAPRETPPEPVEQAEPVETEPVEEPPVTETPEFEELTSVAPSETTALTPVEPEPQEPPEEQAPVETAQPVEPVTPEAPEPEEAEQVETAQAIEPEPEPVPDAPVPTPRPEYTPPPPPRETVQRQPEPQPETQRGDEGQQQASQRRGSSQGQSTSGGAQQSSGNSRAQQAGNAAVSNYPGEIVSRLRRALRYPREARRDGLTGEVHVRFTVTASGGVGGISVASSSGSPILDQAALETVQRAAPFPAIPAGAGRSSWPFTVPLAFTR